MNDTESITKCETQSKFYTLKTAVNSEKYVRTPTDHSSVVVVQLAIIL